MTLFTVRLKPEVTRYQVVIYQSGISVTRTLYSVALQYVAYLH